MSLKDKFIHTETGTVHIKVGSGTATGNLFEPREFDLSETQEAELSSFLVGLDALCERYLKRNVGEIDSSALDEIFFAWQIDQSTPKADPQDIVNALGTSFGNMLCRTLQFRWILVVDNSGTSLGVRHPKVQVYAWPFDTIWKRINAHEHTFFCSVQAMVERGLLERLREEA